jgi:hypothetical protein
VARVHRDAGQGESEHTHAHAAGGAHDRGHDHGGPHAARPPLPPGPCDLTLREVLALAPLVVLIFWIGLYPKFFLDYVAPAVDPIGATVNEFVYAEHGPPQARESTRPLVASGEERP